jgi:cytochrome c553
MIKATSLALATLAGLLSLALPAQAQEAAAGQKKAAMCIGCHGIPGYQSSFPQVHKVPQISGQGAKYIGAALAAYKKGERKHPTMRAIAASLSDQDIADLGAFYEQHGASSVKAVADTAVPAPPAEVGALLAKGACASCHGANFNKPIDPAYPKLAGQHGDYLAVALQAYASDGSNPQVGRANAIMGAQVKPFKRSELKQIADYLATLPGDVRTVPEPRMR